MAYRAPAPANGSGLRVSLSAWTRRSLTWFNPALDNGGWHDSSEFPVGVDNPLNGNPYKPLYFDLGQAIHGANNVPATQQSKGCSRLLVGDQNTFVAWRVNTERTEVERRLSVGIKEDERRPRGNLEVLPDRPGFVDDVIERAQVVFVDELVDRAKTVSSDHADEGDVGCVCCLDLCDRRGFTLTNSSPRRPEPRRRRWPTRRSDIRRTLSDSRDKPHENSMS
jgi:hypothetical protein